MIARSRLLAIADRVAGRLAEDRPSVALHLRRPVHRLATLDPARIGAEAASLRRDLEQLDAIEPDGLSASERAFRAALAIDLARRIDGAATAHHAFAITPYRGGDLHAEAAAAFRAAPLTGGADRDAYLELARDYARLLREIQAHTERQADLGIRLPAAAMPGVRATLDALGDELAAMVRPAPDRGGDAALLPRVDAIIEREIRPAYAALVAFVGGDYARRAPAEAGYAAYPDGDAFYRQQIDLFADTALDAAAIHAIGLDMLAALDDERAALAAELTPGLSLDEADRRLRADPRAHAVTAAEIEATFLRHMGRIEPLMPAWFARRPEAPWALVRASASAEQGMTFGDYQRPTPADPVGRYRYNGHAPETRSLLGAAHLIYHELLPGHHHQLSLQDEAELVHPLQSLLLSMAAVEGWAVYASDLAVEMGAMEAFDRYGHVRMKAFIAARLVVDTGLNALGWTLEQAAAFLRERTIESEATIASEVLRYATDIPGQALAYALGARAIKGFRADAARRLGAGFDVRRFHDVLLGQGAYPLSVLQAQVDDWTRRAA